MSIEPAIEHLVGLQAQTPHTAYTGLWSRLEAFAPEALSDLIVERRVVRLALMRGTIHMVTARDAWGLRPLVQPVLDRVQKTQFGKRLAGVDLDAVVARDAPSLTRSRARSRRSVTTSSSAGRDATGSPSNRRSGRPSRSSRCRPAGCGAGADRSPTPRSRPGWARHRPSRPVSMALVTRYLRAFGPASVMDAQAWCGLTRLAAVFDRLRPGLRHLPRRGRARAVRPARRATAGAGTSRRRRASCTTSTTCCCRTRTGPERSAPRRPRRCARRSRNRSARSPSTGSSPGRGGSSARSRVERPRSGCDPSGRLTKRDTAGVTDEGAGLLAFLATETPDHRIRIELP